MFAMEVIITVVVYNNYGKLRRKNKLENGLKNPRPINCYNWLKLTLNFSAHRPLQITDFRHDFGKFK